MEWKDVFKAEREKPYYKQIINLVQEDAKLNKIYPKHSDIFNAFKLCKLNSTRVVILGMDPYHGEGQAHGLSFSVLPGVKIPPSLKNIYTELNLDLGLAKPEHGCLVSWAKQGVLLLNSILTVRDGQPGSHKNFGWQLFTDRIISVLNDQQTPIVFMLWGNFAKTKKVLITNRWHLVLESGHPSPLSAHLFLGCKHFSKCNSFLTSSNKSPIDWNPKL